MSAILFRSQYVKLRYKNDHRWEHDKLELNTAFSHVKLYNAE